jgi:hypothetical protein
MISANNIGTAGLGFWNSTIGGAIYNSGVISIGNAQPFASGILLSRTQIANGITNAATGIISSSKYGIYTSSANTVSGITNEGTISGVTAFSSSSQTVLPTIQNQPGALISGKLSLLSATTLANSGIVSLPTATSSTMAGSYTQSSTGIFRTGVSSASSLGKLTVGGTVTLPSNANFDVVTGDAANCSGITLGGTIAGVITATGSLAWDDTAIVNDDCTNLHFEARRNSGNTNVIDLVAVVPPSNWSVTSGTGVNGTVSCTTPVLNNGTATCTATPDPGYQLSAASGAAWCGTVSMSGNSITASPVTNTCIINGTFAAIPYTITATASPSAGGTVTCSPNPVNSGSSSTCTPTAATGYTFSSFSGDCSGSTCTLTNVTANKSVSANFVVNAVAGQCGPANGVATLTSPLAQNLCTTGTASNVTAAAGGYSWSCAGVGSGAPASCTAPGAVPPGSTGTATFELLSGSGCTLQSVNLLAPPVGGPGNGVTMPYGVVDFVLVSCIADRATVRMTYSGTIEGMQFWKYINATWRQVSDVIISGNTATFTIVDNGPYDADNQLGVIADPGGPGVGPSAASIPTLSEWGLILMAGLLGMFGLAQVRRGKGVR